MCPGCLLFVIVKSDFVHVHCIVFSIRDDLCLLIQVSWLNDSISAFGDSLNG